MTKYRFIIVVVLIFSFLNGYSRRFVRHGLIGGSYVYETHFKNYIYGFEINFIEHSSTCTQSKFKNSYGLNFLFGKNFQEIGVSYINPFFRKISRSGHSGWNLIYKLNPNYVIGQEISAIMIKPGIGAIVFSGARVSFLTIHAFVLYNYDIYLQMNQNLTGLSNHSIQIGVFIGFQAFEIGIRRNRKQDKIEGND